MQSTTLLVPDAVVDANVEIVALLHPKTGEPAHFVVQGLDVFQLVVVDETAHPHAGQRSLYLEDGSTQGFVNQDSSLTVLTPVNPVFMFLPAVFRSPKASLPLDVLLDFTADDNTQSLPEDLAKHVLPRVCDITERNGEGFYQLSLEKLDAFLLHVVENVTLPASYLSRFERAIAPIDHTQPMDPELLAAAHKYAATTFISSWLPEPAVDRLNDLVDFTSLITAVEQLQVAHAQALAVQTLQSGAQNGSAAPAAKRKGPAPKTKAKVQVTNNRSVLDMFKRAPKP